MLQGPEALAKQQAEQAALREQGENPHCQPGRETIRPKEGLGLFSLMFLDGDDLRHPLRRDLPGGGVDRGVVVAAREHRAQVIGGDQGIPQGHVDPLPPVGRHRVRRVPQEQQAGARPGLQAADHDIQQRRVLERLGVGPQVRGQVGRGAVQQLLAEPFRPGGLQRLVLALLDGHADPQPAVGRRYPAREAARTQFEAHGRAVGPEVGEGHHEVQDVEVLRRRQLGESPPLADRRITAIGADDQVRRELPRPVRAIGLHPHHAVPRPDQVPERCPQVELEGRVLAGLLGEHSEDRRLGDEAADEAQRLGRDPGPPPAPLVEVDRVDDGPGELAEPVPEPHLVEGIDAAGLQPVAAEGARKVAVPLQQRDLHPAAGQQVGEGRSGGPRPNDDHASDRHDATPFSLGTITVPTLLPNYELYRHQNFPNTETTFHYQKQLSADGKFRLSTIGNS